MLRDGRKIAHENIQKITVKFEMWLWKGKHLAQVWWTTNANTKMNSLPSCERKESPRILCILLVGANFAWRISYTKRRYFLKATVKMKLELANKDMRAREKKSKRNINNNNKNSEESTNGIRKYIRTWCWPRKFDFCGKYISARGMCPVF